MFDLDTGYRKLANPAPSDGLQGNIWSYSDGHLFSQYTTSAKADRHFQRSPLTNLDGAPIPQVISNRPQIPMDGSFIRKPLSVATKLFETRKFTAQASVALVSITKPEEENDTDKLVSALRRQFAERATEAVRNQRPVFRYEDTRVYKKKQYLLQKDAEETRLREVQESGRAAALREKELEENTFTLSMWRTARTRDGRILTKWPSFLPDPCGREYKTSK